MSKRAIQCVRQIRALIVTEWKVHWYVWGWIPIWRNTLHQVLVYDQQWRYSYLKKQNIALFQQYTCRTDVCQTLAVLSDTSNMILEHAIVPHTCNPNTWNRRTRAADNPRLYNKTISQIQWDCLKDKPPDQWGASEMVQRVKCLADDPISIPRTDSTKLSFAMTYVCSCPQY